MPPSDPPLAEPLTTSDKPVFKNVDWTDFRDHLATADQQGRRMWLYPKDPEGRYTTVRKWVNIVLITIMFTGPFIRINGNPLLMMNILERRFVILGQVFWPQDLPIFATAMLIFLTGIAIFTAAFGRLWCGWTCPQTVMMEGVFRKLEFWIEGDHHVRRELDRGPWTLGKVLRKTVKHAVFLGLSFVVGNTLLAYIIGSEELSKIITDSPTLHVQGLTFMILFALLFYGIFARFREQACTFICPYGRFMSALLDENTIVVAYDKRRGERRETLHRSETPAARQASGAGDCIDCRQCVVVCPTGIDIRDGTQMECVSCTACIDACDNVMDKIKHPRGLIRYASLNGIETGEPLRVTPRLIGYSVVLLALVSLFVYLLFTRTAVQSTLLRARSDTLFQQTADGKIVNLYLLKVVNKTHLEIPLSLKLEGSGGSVKVMGGALRVPGEKLVETSVLIEMDPAKLTGGSTPLSIGVYREDEPGKPLEVLNTFFIGPRN